MRSIVKFIKVGGNNKAELTEKELNELLEDAYNNGYLDGFNARDKASPSVTSLPTDLYGRPIKLDPPTITM